MVIDRPVNTPEAWSARAMAEDTSWAAAGWSEAGQHDRFVKVIKALNPLLFESLLDYGCGTGALVDWLPTDIDYVGFDMAVGMVQRAQSEHPGRRFQMWEPQGAFDLVVCIGPFNLPGSKLETWADLRRLWDRTLRALAVSLYAGDDPNCLSYTLSEVERFASGEAYRWSVEKWRPNDILMVLER